MGDKNGNLSRIGGAHQNLLALLVWFYGGFSFPYEQLDDSRHATRKRARFCMQMRWCFDLNKIWVYAVNARG